MGRLGALVHGMGALAWFAGIGRLVAAVRRAVRPVSGQPRRARLQPDGGRAVPGMGLAVAVCAQHRAGRYRPLYPSWHPRNAGLFTAAAGGATGPHAGSGGTARASQGNSSQCICTDGGTGTVLHLYGVRVLLRGRDAQGPARLRADGRTDRFGPLLRDDPTVWTSLGPVRAQADLPAWGGPDRYLRLHLFRASEHRCPGPDLPCDRAVAHPP